MFSKAAFLGALLATAVSNVAAVDNSAEVSFVLGNTATLLYSRMDPIVNPGGVSGHMHQILGGSNFRDVLNSPEEMQRAHCSTTKISADKSNYWTPTLYFMWPNGTYTPLTSNTRIYYDLRPSDKGQKVVPFPDGLRMLSGLAMFRDEGAEQSQGVRISYNRDHNEHGKFLPRKRADAPNEVIMSIFFPRCGHPDQLLDSPDHFSHMAHPVSGNLHEYNVASDKCPDTHPIMYPKMLIESIFSVTDEMKEKWNPNDSNFILANGDVTGVTYHGDFVNGWDKEVLQRVIDQDCRVGDNLQNCRAFDGLLDQDDSRFNCRYQGQILSEDVGFLKPLSSLPGCNAKWGWDDGPAKPTECPEPNKPTPGYVNPQFQLETFYGIAVPLAVPGYKEDPFTIPLPDLDSVSRGYGVKVNNWGATRTVGHEIIDKPVDQPMELEASQADVDAAANGGGNKHPAVNGLFDKNEYTATKAAQPVDLARITQGSGDGHFEAKDACDRQPNLLLPCGKFNRTVGIFGGSTAFAMGEPKADTNAKEKAAQPTATAASSGFSALPTESASASANAGALGMNLANVEAPANASASANVSASASSAGAASSAINSDEPVSASASASSAIFSGEPSASSASASASGSASSAIYSGEPTSASVSASASGSASSAAYSGEAVPSSAASSGSAAASSGVAASSGSASASGSSAVFSGEASAATSAAAEPTATEAPKHHKGKKCRTKHGKHGRHGKHRRSRMRSASHF